MAVRTPEAGTAEGDGDGLLTGVPTSGDVDDGHEVQSLGEVAVGCPAALGQLPQARRTGDAGVQGARLTVRLQREGR